MTEFNKIAIYHSHDSNVCYKDSSGYRIIEYERIAKERFASILKANDPEKAYTDIFNVIKLTRDPHFNICYHMGMEEDHQNIVRKIFGVNEFRRAFHHQSHARSAFYQSGFDKALVVSFDGGGLDQLEGEDRVTFLIFLNVIKMEELIRLKLLGKILEPHMGFVEFLYQK